MTKIIQRHDTAANWASVNPILAQGEMGIETDTRKFKFGDGTTAWTDLAYASSEGGGGGTSDYNELTNKPKINNVELSGNNTSTDLGLQDVFSTENPINMRVETINSTKNVAIDKDTNVVTASSTQNINLPTSNTMKISATNNLDKEGVVFNNYISLPIDENTVYVNNTNNIFLGLYAADGSFIPKFVFGSQGGGSDGAFYISSIANSGNYKACTTALLGLSSSIRSETLARAIRIDKANNTVYLSNNQSRGTKPCILTNEIHINALRECTTVMLVSSQASLDYGLQNTKSYWIGALQYDSTEFKIPTVSEAASLPKKYPDDAIVTRYLNLNVDNTTIKINESGALEAIAPANMITTDNIASNTTISAMNSAIEVAQGNITTLSETIATKTNNIQAAIASMPSSRFIDLELGATDTTYTAPANGWFYLNKLANSDDTTGDKYVLMLNTANNMMLVHNGGAKFNLTIILPVLKGNIVNVAYNSTGNTTAFRFIYAEGDI